MARPSWNHAPAAFLIVSLLVVLEIGTVAACPFHSRSGRTLSRKPGGEGHKLKKSQNAASVRRVWPSSRALMSAPEPQLDAVSGLDYNYYAKSCPSLQAVVNRHMAAAYGDDDTSTAPIMRLLFHDCFVRGCDASFLLDSTANNSAEIDAFQDLTLDGFDVIDAIKAELELVCPKTVSCADIVALSAASAVATSNGPNISLPLGRLDGFVSKKNEALNQLPNATASVDQLIELFAAVGLSVQDMVVLSGSHTFGAAHCINVVSRLYPSRDLLMSTDLFLNLSSQCPSGDYSNDSVNTNDTVNLNMFTDDTVFTNQYYINLLNGNGVLQSDQILASDNRTRGLVESLATEPDLFFSEFTASFTQLSRTSVLVAGRDVGEIRTNCHVSSGPQKLIDVSSKASDAHAMSFTIRLLLLLLVAFIW